MRPVCSSFFTATIESGPSCSSEPLPPYESNICLRGIKHLFRHTVNSCCLGSLIGKDETQCFVYPLFLADKSVEMVEFVRWIVLGLDGEASLGFDDIGHTF